MAPAIAQWLDVQTRTISLTSAVSSSQGQCCEWKEQIKKVANKRQAKDQRVLKSVVWNTEITVWKSCCCEPITFQPRVLETHHHDTSPRNPDSHIVSPGVRNIITHWHYKFVMTYWISPYLLFFYTKRPSCRRKDQQDLAESKKSIEHVRGCLLQAAKAEHRNFIEGSVRPVCFMMSSYTFQSPPSGN